MASWSVPVGRTTLRVCTRRFGTNSLVNLKWGKGLAHWKLAVRSKSSEVGMNEFIRPSVVVPLHVGGCQLDSSRVDHDNELHEENRGWHMLRLLVQEGKDVTLIVGNQAETSTEQRLPPQDKEEMSQDQSAKHFECCNLPGWLGHHPCEPSSGRQAAPCSRTTRFAP